MKLASRQDQAQHGRIDDHEQERIEKRPKESQDGAAVAGFQLPSDQALDEDAVAEKLAEIGKKP
jgi:hypothetical protein